MDFLDLIKERKSVRKYKDEGIEEGILYDLLDAARLAPSGGNKQPWSYRFVIDQTEKDKLYEEHVFKQKFVYNAPVITVCCTDPNAYTDPIEGWDASGEVRADRDVNFAAMYLVLRATELGLGTCIVGWKKEDKLKKILDIEERLKIPYVITIGSPDEEPTDRGRKSVDDIILGPKLDIEKDLTKWQ